MPGKPKGYPRLNVQHPLARGLVGAWIFNEGPGWRRILGAVSPQNDVAIDAIGASDFTWTVNGLDMGISTTMGRVQVDGVSGVGGIGFGGLTEYSYFCRTDIIDDMANNTPFFVKTTQGEIAKSGHQLASFGDAMYFYSDSEFEGPSNSNMIVAGESNVALAGVRDGNNYTFYKNGEPWGTVIGSMGAPPTGQGYARLGLSGSGNASISPWKGVVRSVYLYDRALSSEDIRALTHDEYQIFDEGDVFPWLRSISGGPTFSGGGGLAVQNATLDGVAVLPSVASGALDAELVTLAGSAMSAAPDFAASGGFNVGPATLDGLSDTIEPVFINAGDFVVGAALLSGAAVVTSAPGTFAASGNFASDGAALAGTGAWTPTDIEAIGAFDAELCALGGAALTFEESVFTGGGTFDADFAVLSGAGATANLLDAVGGFIADPATLRGVTFLDPTEELGIVIGSIATRPSLRAEVKVNDTG